MKLSLVFAILMVCWQATGRSVGDGNGINDFPVTNELKQGNSQQLETSSPSYAELTESTTYQGTKNFTVLFVGCPFGKIPINGRCRPINKVM
jgi:hypothetical protein